jgi:hypothetical protein
MLGLKTITLGPKLGGVCCAMAAVLRVAAPRRKMRRTREIAGIALRGLPALDLTKGNSGNLGCTAPIKLCAMNWSCQAERLRHGDDWFGNPEGVLL